MLAKKLRLNLSDSANRKLFKTGRRWQDGGFQVYFDFGGLSEGRVAALLTKAIFPKASDRTALRRRVYLAVAPFLASQSKLRMIIKPVDQDLLNKKENHYQEVFRKFFKQLD